MLVWTVVFLLVWTPSFGTEYEVHIQQMLHNEAGPVKNTGSISCACNGRNERKEIPGSYVKSLLYDAFHNNICKATDTSEICEMINGCNICEAEAKFCRPGERRNEYVCDKRLVTIAKKKSNNPDIKGSSSSLQRRPRQVRASCLFPKELRTADISCTYYPSSIRCTQKCIYGYTLKEGISRKVSCLYSENKWKPTGFEECRPFVDCSIELLLPGELKCQTQTSTQPLSCKLKCHAYETMREQQESLACTLTGWNKKLLLCALSKPTMELAPAPRIKLHPIEKNQNKKSSNALKSPEIKSNEEKSNMMKPSMTKPDVSKSNIPKPDVSKSNIPKPDVSKSNIPKSNMTNPELKNSNMTKSNLTDSSTKKSNMTKSSTFDEDDEDWVFQE